MFNQKYYENIAQAVYEGTLLALKAYDLEKREKELEKREKEYRLERRATTGGWPTSLTIARAPKECRNG